MILWISATKERTESACFPLHPSCLRLRGQGQVPAVLPGGAALETLASRQKICTKGFRAEDGRSVFCSHCSICFFSRLWCRCAVHWSSGACSRCGMLSPSLFLGAMWCCQWGFLTCTYGHMGNMSRDHLTKSNDIIASCNLSNHIALANHMQTHFCSAKLCKCQPVESFSYDFIGLEPRKRFGDFLCRTWEPNRVMGPIAKYGIE